MDHTDFFSQALNSTHTYGEPETLLSYRDRDGAQFFFAPGAQTVEVRTRIRRLVITTYPDGTVAEGWESLGETTEPYMPRP